MSVPGVTGAGLGYLLDTAVKTAVSHLATSQPQQADQQDQVGEEGQGGEWLILRMAIKQSYIAELPFIESETRQLNPNTDGGNYLHLQY